MDKPEISVIIPAFSRTDFLESAVRSVLSQTFRNFELFIVHNGGNDGPREVAERLVREDSRVKYFHLQEAGAVAARNFGAGAARGDYLAFLDDDDEWMMSKLERQLKVFGEFPETDLVYCRAVRVFEGGREEEDKIAADPHITFEQLVIEGCTLRSLSGVLVERKKFQGIPAFDAQYDVANDYDYYLRFVLKYSIRFLDEVLYRYYCHSGNLSNSPAIRFKETIRVLRKRRSEETDPARRRLLKKGISRYGRRYFAEAVDAADRKDYRAASKYYFSAVYYMPSVGLNVEWSRYPNRGYKFLRPYLLAAICALRSLNAPKSASR